MSETLPPSFFLYGETPKAADPDFIHVEGLAARSKPSGWHIAAHKHADLSHLILISQGGGTILYETESIAFTAPKLLVVPANIVHGFDWSEDSDGLVLTIAKVQLEHIFAQHGEFAQLFGRPRCIDLGVQECRALEADISEIARELSWISLGQNAALQSFLQLVMVRAARQLQAVEAAPSQSPRQDALMARFRQLLEQRFRFREPVAAYARELAISQTALREACAAHGQSPVGMRDQRAILEAQRLLAFSIMPIAQIGESIGIDDPAYFSRFFARKCGVSPGQWRRDLKQSKQTA